MANIRNTRPNLPSEAESPQRKLRDEFAMAALQSGEASNWLDNEYTPLNGMSIIENTAICAYRIADAMLKAREIEP